MDWSIFIYFLAAVTAAGVSYAVWPKNQQPKLTISNDSLSDETSHEDPKRRAA